MKRRRILGRCLLALVLALVLMLAITPVALAATETGSEGPGLKALLAENTLFIQLVVIVGLVLIDFVGGVARALVKGQFEWAKLAAFLKTNVVPYVLVWGVVAGVGYGADFLDVHEEALASMAIFVDVVYAVIVGRILASIMAKFKDLGIKSAGK